MPKVEASSSDWAEPQRRIEALKSAQGRRELERRPFGFLRRLLGRGSGREAADLLPGIYILAYHGIVDESGMQEWERCYRKGAVTLTCFQNQVESIARHFTPTTLEQVPALFSHGAPERPYAVFTFDDGYANLTRNALPVLRKHGIAPTVFLNGRFAGTSAYYRVLAAMLTAKGETAALREALAAACPDLPWAEEPERLFNQTKDQYRPGLVENAVEAAYRARIGEPLDLHAHLTVDEVRGLKAEGWSFGDHTFGHTILPGLDGQQVEQACNANRAFWREAGVDLIAWLAYPNGRSIDVGGGVSAYLDRYPATHGIFCNGGVNLAASKRAWLRFCPGNWQGEETLARLQREAELSRTALQGRSDG